MHRVFLILAKPLDRTLDDQITCTVCIAGESQGPSLGHCDHTELEIGATEYSELNTSKYCGGLHVVAYSKNWPKLVTRVSGKKMSVY